MTAYLFLPIAFFKFWYVEAPAGIIQYFFSLNKAFLHLFSLPLFLRTFFRPLKNEYRDGLIGFSVAMGVVVKSVLIAIDLALLGVLVLFEAAVLLYFLFLPVISIYILFL